jgi:hypothetical protein
MAAAFSLCSVSSPTLEGEKKKEEQKEKKEIDLGHARWDSNPQSFD